MGGIAVLVFPRTSLVALAQVPGVILLIFGGGYLALRHHPLARQERVTSHFKRPWVSSPSPRSAN